ncbi:GcrA family cell cycle regulator [Methylobacterium sp. Leaf87]|uniref:GcrA family cell cycle regulator n=1 Tax=Methylobacterium sp. Leaf87 TaxID=1736243 RepID=UPI003296F6A3
MKGRSVSAVLTAKRAVRDTASAFDHPVGPRPATPYFRESNSTMNQLVRMSQVGEADAIAEPSASLRVPFAQSGAFVCKFIIGEPNDRAVCCGASVPDGKSWCAYHRRIVFEPARPGRLR